MEDIRLLQGQWAPLAQRLSHLQRRVLMALAAGLSRAEVAASLGMSEKNVTKALERAREFSGLTTHQLVFALVGLPDPLASEGGIWDLPTCVYRLFDFRGVLLYVGTTHTFGDRMRQHHSKSWWPQVARWVVVDFPNRETALCAELDAIRLEHPLYNVRGAA